MNTHKTERLHFKLEAVQEGSAARAATFETLHNKVETPVFMPVATLAVLRNQDSASAHNLGYPVLLANTYHLLLRPGTEVFKKFGGIHQFMNWEHSVLTDSGGFQVFSLANDVRITEEGALFRSYHDGRRLLLSPETSIETQGLINSDIMMAMDQCIPSTSDETLTLSSVEITARWAERSLIARGDSPQALFGIVQGACYPNLRKQSASQITALPFDGFAIGGLAVGETESERKDMTELTASLLPVESPRYLMGVGTPIDLLEAVHRGVDMFDCILPTAMAAQGVAYTSHGRMELRRGVYKLQDRPLDEGCSCSTCTRYSRAYLHHLIKTGEYHGRTLIGQHNLHFYKSLMDAMRSHILQGSFLSFYNDMKDKLIMTDEEHPVTPPKKKKRKRPARLGDFEVVRQDEGFHSIRHLASGEIMHSVSDPVKEAEKLYVNQARLAKELCAVEKERLIIWDVGLGGAANAMAAISRCEKFYTENEGGRPVTIFSFEKDLDALRLAVKNPSLFHYVRHAAPGALLEHGRWKSKDEKIEWKLVEGDFQNEFEHITRPHLIFYDPFSIKTDGELWSYELFKRLYAYCKTRAAKLFTYSCSTRVRAALLAAGFYTGSGAGTGPKSDTTAAFTSLEVKNEEIDLLDASWLNRFEASSAKWSEDCSDAQKKEIEDKVLGHPQFQFTNEVKRTLR